MSYLNMPDLFFNFVCATQIGGWALHLQSAAEMVPWYFAYDHLNYAKHLPVYIYVMLAVPDTHPSVFCSSATKPVLLQSDINGSDN